MDSICRICLGSSNDLINLSLQPNEENITVNETRKMFENCFDLILDDIIECQKICMNCKIQLSYFYNFKLQATKSHVHLMKLTILNFDSDSQSQSSIFEEAQGTITYLNDESNADGSKLEGDCVNIEYLEEETEVLDTKDIYENGSTSGFEVKKECHSDTQIDEEDELHSDVLYEYISNVTTDKDNDSKVRKKEGSKFKKKCDICGKNFRNDDTYEAHMNVHKGLPAYQCTRCTKSFKYKVNYEYHMKNHDNDRNFKCDLCDKSFLVHWDLKLHLRVHYDTRPFVCELCGKKFRVRSHMTDHIETHNEANNYECPTCFQKYKTKATLKMHISSIHKKLQQYFCPICVRSFNRSHHLKVHIKTHEPKEIKESSLVLN